MFNFNFVLQQFEEHQTKRRKVCEEETPSEKSEGSEKTVKNAPRENDKMCSTAPQAGCEPAMVCSLAEKSARLKTAIEAQEVIDLVGITDRQEDIMTLIRNEWEDRRQKIKTEKKGPLDNVIPEWFHLTDVPFRYLNI